MTCTHDATEMMESEAEIGTGRVIVPLRCLDCGEEFVKERQYDYTGEHRP